MKQDVLLVVELIDLLQHINSNHARYRSWLTPQQRLMIKELYEVTSKYKPTVIQSIV